MKSLYWFFRRWHVSCYGVLIPLLVSINSWGACGTTITWQADANTVVWNNTNNWNPRNIPNVNTETAFIRADWQIPTFPAADTTLSCLEINSGSMTASAASTLTIANDYFKNLNTGALILPGGSTFRVTMAGTATQSFENVDPIPRLNINNATTVNLTQPFVNTTDFTITAGSGNVNIQANLETQQVTAITIPSSATVTLSSGVEWKVNGGLTINGILKLMPGASLKIANGRTLSVGATGTLQIAGTAGNVGTIDAYNSSSTYTFNVIGKIDAEYFSINRMTAAGVNVTGQILDFSNGVINYIPDAGYGITLGAAATSISTLNAVGFYGQGAASPLNVNATAYAGSVITFNNYSGIGGAANETDPGSRIAWGTPAGVELLLTNNSPSGTPPTTIAASSAYTHFATFAFALSSASTASDITSIEFTIYGTNSSSDLAGARVFRDDNNNCVYNAGVDTQVGGTYTPVGNPATFTATFAASDIQVSNTSSRCVHVLLATSATAQANHTVGVRIASTDDVVNSQNYSFSSTSGPPVSANTSTITGTAVLRWAGGNGTVMAQANNWSPNTIPSNTRDCQIGNGFNIPIMAATFSCRNTEYLSGGTINWNNTANIFQVYGSFTGSTGFTFQNTTNTAIMRFIGAATQSVNFNGATFPGSVQVNNTTGPVIFESDATINGSLTLNNGITRIASGVTLRVNNGITVNSPAILDIEPGATLVMANGTTMTVALGGTLEMVGTTGSSTAIRAVNDASSYTITISGNISARYYSLRNLGLNGLTINAGATIDPTNQLQNGSYSYPGANNAQLLRLLRQVPGNTLDSMTFTASGSAATGVRSITTNTTAGTLNMTNYSGDMTGDSFSTSVNYIVTWVSPTNTLDLTQEATAPGSSDQGAVVNMGRFGFKQTSAGAYADTDITYMRLTLTGTGSASDVDNVSLYYDSACSGSGGTLIGTQTFSGSPARADFSSIAGATVQTDPTTPPKRCFYVTFSISSTATNAATVGVEIQSASHVTNTQSYAFNGSYAPAVNLGTTSIVGTTTYWTGATSNVWTLAGNWNGGVPTSTLNCVINAAVNNPVISAGTQACKSVTIGTGTLTMTGGSLEVYGSFENTGTFTQGAFPLVIRDNGVTPTSQSLSSSSTLTSIQFNKTAGGTVSLQSNTLTVTNAISMPGGSNFTFSIGNNKTLSASGGITVTGGTLSVDSGGIVQIGSGQTLTLNGGTIATTGTNDTYPQSLSNKGTFTRQASGTWNFTATSGTLNLVGFVFEWLGTSGLNIGGTTNVTQINGGQLRSLPNSAGMRAIQINTTGTLPSTISNFGWYWGSGNSVPAEGTSYFLGFSSGCSSRTVTFDQWFGDFWPYTTASTDDKISETNCDIVINKANSPVSLTEFKATPYNGSVVLEWTTGLEWYHKGFNIYRSISPDAGYVQINAELIRNDLFSANMHGSYAYVDNDVQNDTIYYYKLEDISTTEERTLHGPLSAKPLLILGAAPPPLASTIVSSNPNGSGSSGGTGSVNATPGLIQLEPNITLLAKTQNSYRIKITIPSLQITPDVSYPTYQHLNIPLYSKTTTAGHPELLQRTYLLKIIDANIAQMQIVSSQSTLQSPILVAPAMDWVVSHQQYQAQWLVDAAAYASSQWSATEPITLGSIVEQNGQSYLPLLIHPVHYQPNTQTLRKYSEVVVDIFLNHQTWTQPIPLVLGQEWAYEGALRIGVKKDGMYEISFEDMYDAGVIAPFDHADVSKFKLFFMNQEHALEIVSGNGSFSPGDKIRFFAPHTETVESEQSYVLLVPDSASLIDGLRMATYATAAVNNNLAPSSFSARMHLEENNVAVFNEPYDQDMDLFVWGLFYGIAGGAKVSLSTEVDMSTLDPMSEVTVQAVVKSRRTSSDNYSNHLQILVNDQLIPGGSASFQGSQVQIVTLKVPASYFAPGRNKITLEPTGNNLISGEYDMVYIDSIDIYYNHLWQAKDDHLLVFNNSQGVDLSIEEFTSANILIYDLSNFGLPEIWTGAQVAQSDSYRVEFNTAATSPQGRRLWLTTDQAFYKPTSLELNRGSQLANPANEADVIYVGSEELLDAIEPLANLREEQGYKVQKVLLQSIYNEFGKGIISLEAIREFFVYANTYWTVKPKYFILLGDGTYDPKAYQNDEIKNRFPVKLLKGVAFNYGSDSWFVTEENATVPFAVVGRIPARTPAEMQDYAQKVRSYEQGETKPATAQLSVFSDKVQYAGENFSGQSQEMIQELSVINPALKMTHLQRAVLGDTAFKQTILDGFNTSSLIHYMGHGAENMWADNVVFNNLDVDNLSNSRLPIVTAMNCLNANFYDPDLMSMAEKLVMKKQGGAIAFWGSTSITPPSVQHTYQKAFYEQMLKNPSSDLGGNVKVSKALGAQISPFNELIMSWTILGDPMVKPVLPVQNKSVEQEELTKSSNLHASSGCALVASSGKMSYAVSWDLLLALVLEFLISLTVIRSLQRVLR